MYGKPCSCQRPMPATPCTALSAIFDSVDSRRAHLCDEPMSGIIRPAAPPAAPPRVAEVPSKSPLPDAAASSAANLDIDDNGCSGRSRSPPPWPFLLFVPALANPRDGCVLAPRIGLLVDSRVLLRWRNADSLLLPSVRIVMYRPQRHEKSIKAAPRGASCIAFFLLLRSISAHSTSTYHHALRSRCVSTQHAVVTSFPAGKKRSTRRKNDGFAFKNQRKGGCYLKYSVKCTKKSQRLNPRGF